MSTKNSFPEIGRALKYPPKFSLFMKGGSMSKMDVTKPEFRVGDKVTYVKDLNFYFKGTLTSNYENINYPLKLKLRKDCDLDALPLKWNTFGYRNNDRTRTLFHGWDLKVVVLNEQIPERKEKVDPLWIKAVYNSYLKWHLMRLLNIKESSAMNILYDGKEIMNDCHLCEYLKVRKANSVCKNCLDWQGKRDCVQIGTLYREYLTCNNPMDKREMVGKVENFLETEYQKLRSRYAEEYGENYNPDNF